MFKKKTIIIGLILLLAIGVITSLGWLELKRVEKKERKPQQIETQKELQKVPETTTTTEATTTPESTTTSTEDFTIPSEEEIINKIINEIIPSNYERKYVEYWKGDLNNDGNQEIIITAIPSEKAEEAYLAVVTILDKKGAYKKIADFDFNEITKRKFKFTFGQAPAIKMVKDINNDGLIEIQLGWLIGAPRLFATNVFLALDYSHQKITWLQLIDGNNNIVPAIFDTGWGGGTGGFVHGSVHAFDINKDGKLEIIAVKQESPYSMYEKIKIEKWTATIYEWNGSIFSYNKDFSISGTDDDEMPKWLKKIISTSDVP